VSGSWRCVTKRDWPGRRLSIQTWISASVRGMRGGVPSTTQPIAGPWLSPQLVNRKRVPKLLPAIIFDRGCRPPFYSPSKLPSSSAICFADEVLIMPTIW